MFPDKVNKIIAGAIFAIMLAIYLMTVAPTISFWDCGEFVTCSYIMGIPHPPGSPLLSLIGRVMSLIPFYDLRGYGVGEIAYRVNMIDVILGALTVMFTYLIMVRLLHKLRPYNGRKLDEAVIMFAAAVTAFVAGFSDEFWTNAIEIETYMPSLFMQMLAVWLTLKWDERKDDPRAVKYLFLAAYIIGLGNGVHLTVLLIAPVIILFVLFSKPEWFRDPKLWGTTILFVAAMGFLKTFGGYALFYFLMAVFALVVPFMLYSRYQRTNPAWLVTFMGIVFCSSLFIIGYSVYPTVMVRAAKNPAINEGNPDTWERYKNYMEREQYGQENMYTGAFTRKASAGYQFNYMFLRYLIKQFPKWGPTITFTFQNDRAAENRGASSGPVTDYALLSIFLLALILYGLYTHAAGDWRRFMPLLLFFFMSSIGLVLYLNMENPQVRERPYFFLGAFYIVMYWIGFGMYGIMIDIADWLRAKNHARAAVPVVTIIALAFFTLVPTSVLSNHIDPEFTQYETHDRTGDWAPKDYGYNILVSCEQDGILFTNGDNDTFPLWYLQFVEGFRKDVRVVNLSLLNTSWYILQMKHEGEAIPSPEEVDALLADTGQILVDRAVADTLGVMTTNVTKTVPIEMEDDYIENVVCGRDDTATNRRLITGEGRTVSAAGIEWYMPAFYKLGQSGMYRIQDEMVYNVIRWVNWQRPIYFAVTVAQENMIGLDDYLAMEGMVYRLTPEKAPEGEELVNVAALDRNVLDHYQYHALADTDVYKPPNTVKLVSNYFVGFAQLTDRYLSMGDPDNALRAAWGSINNTPSSLANRRFIYRLFASYGYADKVKELLAWEFDNNDILNDPTGNIADRMALYALLVQTGDTTRADEFIALEQETIDPASFQDRVDFGAALVQVGLNDQGLAYFQKLARDFPASAEAAELLTYVAANLNRFDVALDAAERMVEMSPNSSDLIQRRDLIRQMYEQQLAADSVTAAP